MITPMDAKAFQAHLDTEHKVSPISEYLKEIVYGGNDGIVTTFAVVAGFTGAASADPARYSIMTVLLFGLANLFADGASMGLGNFLAVRSEQKIYHQHRKRELKEIQNEPDHERSETVYLLMEKGYSREDAEQLTRLYASNEEYWTDFMMEKELGLSNPEGDSPALKALATFLAFVLFGAIPILPYVVVKDVMTAFWLSLGSSLLALVILGAIRGLTTKEKLLSAIGETVLVGSVAGSVAYLVGTLF